MRTAIVLSLAIVVTDLPQIQAHLQCDLYLAESTIPGAGLGVFTGLEKRAGDTIGNGDLVFPLFELELHHLGTAFDELASETYFYNPFDDYVWDGRTMGMGTEVWDTVTACWPGMDAMINCFIPLENVNRTFPTHQSHGDVLNYMPHRSKDPMAGAMTTYRAGTTLVRRDIPAGGELFKNYGDEWFLTRKHTFGFVPLSEDYKTADALIKEMGRLQFPPLLDFLAEIRDLWGTSRVLNAIPKTMEDVLLTLEKDITYTYQSNSTRSVNWLQEHGKCIDHIVPKPSTITGAGEGAFAKRFLPKNTLVTGSPLMVLPSNKFTEIYEVGEDPETEQMYSTDNLIHRQIMYNYCFGHPESSMLLFPMGAGVHYINHDRARANVKMQWAEPDTSAHNASWLHAPPTTFEWAYKALLGVDWWATRDIEEGEELFMDYGPFFEEALRQHKENWKPSNDTVSATDLNHARSVVRTVTEQATDPYSETVLIRCHVNVVFPEWVADPSDKYKRYEPHTQFEYQEVHGLPCEVIARDDTDDTYTVIISTAYDELVYVTIPDDIVENPEQQGVERDAIFFVDAPYASDLYLSEAFRQPIDIPSHMMQDIWKDKQTTANSKSTEDNSEL